MIPIFIILVIFFLYFPFLHFLRWIVNKRYYLRSICRESTCLLSEKRINYFPVLFYLSREYEKKKKNKSEIVKKKKEFFLLSFQLYFWSLSWNKSSSLTTLIAQRSSLTSRMAQRSTITNYFHLIYIRVLRVYDEYQIFAFWYF